MGLDKAIQSGKEHRRKYYGAKAVDHSCRNHGSCDICKGNRLYRFRKSELQAECDELEANQMNVWINGETMTENKCQCIFWSDSGCVKPSYLNCPSEREVEI